MDDDEDDGDALPAVGKVWDEGPKVSLAALLAQHSAGTGSRERHPPPRPAGRRLSTRAGTALVAPVDDGGVWKALLEHLEQQGPRGIGLSSLLSLGRFAGVDSDYAVIRFPDANSTIAQMLEKNGKKEQLRDALTMVRGQQTGVRFEVDPPPAAGEASVAPAAPASPAASSRPDPAAARPAPARETRPPEPAPVVNRLTPEVRAALEADPLVKAVLEELGGTIIKAE